MPFTQDDVVDSRGRVLQVEDEVVMHHVPATGVVTKISKILHKDAPPGMLRIQFVSITTMMVEGGVAVQEVTRVQSKQERIDRGLIKPEGDQPAVPSNGGPKVILP